MEYVVFFYNFYFLYCAHHLQVHENFLLFSYFDIHFSYFHIFVEKDKARYSGQKLHSGSMKKLFLQIIIK